MDDSEKRLLKGVSRSFYLSLRLLPLAMRESASLGYFLARTSDTLADTAAAPIDARIECLDTFARALEDAATVPHWPLRILNAVQDSRERELLEHTGNLLAWLQRIKPDEKKLIQDVVLTIISGQKMDLERFGTADQTNPVALASDSELEDYAWRVAGCVGAFWTKLGFLTMGDRFSTQNEATLIELGITYGKGLQLVNILRDLPVDLSNGRCYLPVSIPIRQEVLMAEHERWLERTVNWIDAGFSYAATLSGRRMQVATVLPAMIARETLGKMRGAALETLRKRVKIRRSRVYLAIFRAMTGRTTLKPN